MSAPDLSEEAKPLRGFARLTPEERVELGRKGGSNAVTRYVLPAGDKAREAGRKGAEARWGKKAPEAAPVEPAPAE